ncbi:sensor histidine kinase [Gordonia hydrophobica]|uniref:histidine kinase n=1 Tax=Gordonia hydrophobica TaxID=40516 RepID=A0ABZ2U675_9ACTN|nr:HAMP domain-containing sensor histidine kinase [Gordonia hydrophobica]MBM7367959.1 two-component system OmpR family sensor kinase [Gordonia hydrophobica]
MTAVATTAPDTPAKPRRGVPLRISLVVLTGLLVTLGLVASGFAVTSAMRGDLMSRTDSGLVDAINGWARPRDQDATNRPAPPGPRRPPSQYYVSIQMPNGVVTISDFGSSPDLNGLPDGNLGPTTVDSLGEGPQWRVIKRDSDTGSTTVAVPLTDVQATMSRLIWLQVGIGIVVVVVIAVLSSLLVRSSLRPLRRVEETAHAIAGGDLHQRVHEAPGNTEVGSLGRSINRMLAQIQNSFAATARSEKQARESEAMMRRFVADASHELRTPLTSIKGFSELLTMGAVDREDAVRRIGSEADRMGLLVEDLLMLARLDAQRRLDLGEVEMVSLVADAVEAARAAAPESDIELDVPNDTGDPVVRADPSRLMQVLRNLVGNAVAHAGADARIRVRIDSGPSEVTVTVADDGPGMTADDAAHVFERFYRGDDSRHRDGAGSGNGLGLSIVAALVQAHGGRVGVDTAPGAGARFWFVLPRIDSGGMADGSTEHGMPNTP